MNKIGAGCGSQKIPDGDGITSEIPNGDGITADWIIKSRPGVATQPTRDPSWITLKI